MPSTSFLPPMRRLIPGLRMPYQHDPRTVHREAIRLSEGSPVDVAAGMPPPIYMSAAKNASAQQAKQATASQSATSEPSQPKQPSCSDAASTAHQSPLRVSHPPARYASLAAGRLSVSWVEFGVPLGMMPGRVPRIRTLLFRL